MLKNMHVVSIKIIQKSQFRLGYMFVKRNYKTNLFSRKLRQVIKIL